MLYVLIKITTLTRVFCAVKLTHKVRLVGTYHGKRMCVFGGRAGVRLDVSITPAVLSQAYRFLLVQFKTNKLCIGESLIILIES